MKHPKVIRIEDGTIMGGADGRLWSAFVPRWWQFWRWAWWYLPFWDGKERGVVLVTFKVGSDAVTVSVRLRRYRDPHTGEQKVLPRVPGPDARHVVEQR